MHHDAADGARDHLRRDGSCAFVVGKTPAPYAPHPRLSSLVSTVCVCVCVCAAWRCTQVMLTEVVAPIEFQGQVVAGISKRMGVVQVGEWRQAAGRWAVGVVGRWAAVGRAAPP